MHGCAELNDGASSASRSARIAAFSLFLSLSLPRTRSSPALAPRAGALPGALLEPELSPRQLALTGQGDAAGAPASEPTTHTQTKLPWRCCSCSLGETPQPAGRQARGLRLSASRGR